MSEQFIPHLIGLSGSVFLSGFAFSASYYTLPAAALAPLPLRLQQWLVVYDLGKLISPPLSAISALSWFYTSYTSPSPEMTQLYATAGALTLGTVIWTVGAMRPTNNALMRMAKVAREEKEDGTGSGSGSGSGSGIVGGRFQREAERDLGRWSWMNYVRAVIPLVGGWVGLYAALK